MKTELDPIRCQTEVMSPDIWGHWHQCKRKAVLDGYCKQHHPDTKKAIKAALREKWEKENARRAWEFNAIAACTGMADPKAEIAEMRWQLDELRKAVSVANL